MKRAWLVLIHLGAAPATTHMTRGARAGPNEYVSVNKFPPNLSQHQRHGARPPVKETRFWAHKQTEGPNSVRVRARPTPIYRCRSQNVRAMHFHDWFHRASTLLGVSALTPRSPYPTFLGQLYLQPKLLFAMKYERSTSYVIWTSD